MFSRQILVIKLESACNLLGGIGINEGGDAHSWLNSTFKRHHSNDLPTNSPTFKRFKKPKDFNDIDGADAVSHFSIYLLLNEKKRTQNNDTTATMKINKWVTVNDVERESEWKEDEMEWWHARLKNSFLFEWWDGLFCGG